MDINRYNTRVRQAISDKYVEANKRKQEISRQLEEQRIELAKFMDGKKTLTYKEYIDVKSSIDQLHREDDRVSIEIELWNEAREICLNIADEVDED